MEIREYHCLKCRKKMFSQGFSFNVKCIACGSERLHKVPYYPGLTESFRDPNLSDKIDQAYKEEIEKAEDIRCYTWVEPTMQLRGN